MFSLDIYSVLPQVVSRWDESASVAVWDLLETALRERSSIANTHDIHNPNEFEELTDQLD